MKQVRVAHPEKCSGCILCCLVCSFFQSSEKKFQPSKSFIRPYRKDKTNRFDVEILPDCVHCGACVAYCEYGVLEKVEGSYDGHPRRLYRQDIKS